MQSQNRRQFLVRSGLALGLAANAAWPDSARGALDPTSSLTAEEGSSSGSRTTAEPLYNKNLRTAIGLGDEPAGIVDKFGQLIRSRHAGLQIAFGSPLHPAEKAEWTQSLLNGCLPIVETHLKSGNSSLNLSAFSSDHDGVKADYVEIRDAGNPYRVKLIFPYTTSVKVEEGTITSGERLLAVFPPPRKTSIALAKYNFLTPEAYSSLRPPWTPDGPPLKLPPGVDAAFGACRRNYLHRGIEYRFPVEAGRTYYVFMGIFPDAQKPGEVLLRLSVNDESQQLDFGLVPPGKPVLREFKVSPSGSELRVKAECDPSEGGSGREVELSGIWVFDKPVKTGAVISGSLNSNALFYVPCGNEPIDEMVSSVTFDYGPAGEGKSRWFRLPYDQEGGEGGKVSSISPESARTAEKARWESLLQNAAEFATGVSHLDNLYKTSLINMLLLRTKFPGRGEDGQDIYVVKPGPDLYDTFWVRDGSYIARTFDLAGLPQEAEKSLRLFWHQHLTGKLASWGQQTTGLWAAPTWQWDGQGQALWALGSHFEFTHDQEWLKRVYGSIRRGVQWIESATKQTQFLNENGEKPIYYGLLPVGEGESIAHDFNYYHCFWAVLGLREALNAAQAMGQSDDAEWIKKLYAEFSSNLLTSVRLAYQRVGGGKFIPATPFDPRAPFWGSLTALYPARFLDPHEMMMTHTLEILDAQAQEDTYLYEHNHLWTYITVEGAMCHLLRDELPTFYRLYNGFVAHASPTNAWSEGIMLPNRKGTGDMPHGWGAAEYVTIHRNSLVYENEEILELCWGVQPDWLPDGAKVTAKRAPTGFGIVNLELQRTGSELALDYHLEPASGQHKPASVRLHIPKLKEGITAVRINGQTRPLAPGESAVTLD